MPNQNATAKALPHVLSSYGIRYFEVLVGSAATAADTVTISQADGVDLDTVPVAAIAFLDSGSNPKSYQAMTLTSFDRSTGVLILTVPAAGALSAGDKILITAFANV